MLQQVARVGRLGSKALPSPTLGIRASMINLPMILIEDYTLNPAVRRPLTDLVEIQGMGKESALLYDCHQKRTIWRRRGSTLLYDCHHKHNIWRCKPSSLLYDCHHKLTIVGIPEIKSISFLRTCSGTRGFAGEARCGA